MQSVLSLLSLGRMGALLTLFVATLWTSPALAGGVVSSAHPLATEAGAAVLAEGGSAFDAAVATALVLGVVNPQSSGLGGGGFAVFKPMDGPVASLDFRERAPSFFGPDTYAEPGRDSARGPWAVGIPGEPAGLAALHRRGGKLPWARLVEPARKIAAEGFSVGRDLAAVLKRSSAEVLEDPGLRSVFAPDGVVLSEGALCRRPALAETLAYLQAHGGDSFYKGPLAIAFSGFLSRQGLPWTPAELSSYRVTDRAALASDYRGHRVHSMGPPSSGGIAILQMLEFLEVAEFSSKPAGGPRAMVLLAQAMRHAFADRATFGGDPDFVSVPVEALIDPALGERSFRRTKPNKLPGLLDSGYAGETGASSKVLRPDDGGTSHLSVIDAEGASVSLTTTINLHFGAKLLDPSTGIILNDEMDDFTARPGVPNFFGLVQGEANAVAPGKRPLSSMSPTLVTDGEGRVVLAVGGAGGPRIITGTFQTLLAVIDGGLSAEAAVGFPRVHHQWLPERILAEDGLDETSVQALNKLGLPVDRGLHQAVVHVVGFDPVTGAWSGGADPRAGGSYQVVETSVSP